MHVFWEIVATILKSFVCVNTCLANAITNADVKKKSNTHVRRKISVYDGITEE